MYLAYIYGYNYYSSTFVYIYIFEIHENIQNNNIIVKKLKIWVRNFVAIYNKIACMYVKNKLNNEIIPNMTVDKIIIKNNSR